jgi:hypothetical protein
LRSEGRDNFKFWFWQFLVNLKKCAKFHLNLSRCLPGAVQACADLPYQLVQDGLCSAMRRASPSGSATTTRKPKKSAPIFVFYAFWKITKLFYPKG